MVKCTKHIVAYIFRFFYSTRPLEDPLTETEDQAILLTAATFTTVFYHVPYEQASAMPEGWSPNPLPNFGTLESGELELTIVEEDNLHDYLLHNHHLS